MTALCLLLHERTANAQDEIPLPEEELPIPTLTLDRIPPRYSYDLALHVSYGEIAYFQYTAPPWIGFGLRGGWGKNFGNQRLGLSGTFAAEGEFGLHTFLSVEPAVTWDFVTAGTKGGLQLGASVGPALGYRYSNVVVETEKGFVVAPSAALRVGWSQGWTRVGRRLFVFLEPRVRLASDGLAPAIAIGVGSGGGR